MGNSESSNRIWATKSAHGEKALSTWLLVGAGTAVVALGACFLASSLGTSRPHGRKFTKDSSEPEDVSGRRGGGGGGYAHQPPRDPISDSSRPVNSLESLETEGVPPTWTPPQRGQLNVNFDGSVGRDGNEASIQNDKENTRFIGQNPPTSDVQNHRAKASKLADQPEKVQSLKHAQVETISQSGVGDPHNRQITLEGLEISSRRGGGGGYVHQPPRDAMRCSSQLGDKKPNLSPRMIKIMTYNVWFREDVAVVERMEAIGRIIHQCSPDVIFFQEVTPYIYNLFRYSDWWKVYECSVSPEEAATAEFSSFCMLLSKIPVKEFRCIDFEGSTMRRTLFSAEIDVSVGNKLVAATTHLKRATPLETHSLERIAQARKALSLLRHPTNVVFGGDMNWNEDVDESFPLPDGWVDAWTDLRPSENGWTYDTKSNQMLSGNYWPLQKRLDRFVCKLKDFKLVSVDMIGTEAIPGLTYDNKRRELPVYPSDHYGLLLTISSIQEATATLVPQSFPATFTWTPPQHGQLKVNFDGSVRGGSSSAGFVIRDADGCAVLGGNIAFALCSVPEAELRGAWVGLQVAVEGLHATSIWLEGDSEAVISWIQGGTLSKMTPPSSYSYLQDIQRWISTLDSFKATHVFRDGNKPAGWLAGSATSTSLLIWSSNFPAPLLSLLSADADGRVYARPC